MGNGEHWDSETEAASGNAASIPWQMFRLAVEAAWVCSRTLGQWRTVGQLMSAALLALPHASMQHYAITPVAGLWTHGAIWCPQHPGLSASCRPGTPSAAT